MRAGKWIFRKAKGLALDENGQDLVEYTLLLCVIAGGVLAISQSIATHMAGLFTSISNAV